MKTMKTEYRKKMEARDLAIYNEYTALMSKPEAMPTAIKQYLMKKYEIHAQSTIWYIVKRVEKKLEKEAN